MMVISGTETVILCKFILRSCKDSQDPTLIMKMKHREVCMIFLSRYQTIEEPTVFFNPVATFLGFSSIFTDIHFYASISS